MGFKMSDLKQKIIQFDYDVNFKEEDFFVSKSNKHILNFFDKWPKWEKNFLNIYGEKYSGKSHLINIFLKKFKGIKLEANSLDNKDIKDIKIYENIILENLSKETDEKLLYTLLNTIDQDNKYLIVTSSLSIVDIEFDLEDLRSRTKNFIL